MGGDLDVARKPLPTAFEARTVNFAEVISTHASGLCMWGQRHQGSTPPSGLSRSEQKAWSRRRPAARLPVAPITD